ncbi:DUF523 domain-containing protein [Candidatus Enterococcus clewellii]|uniref:Uncharacterized protein n=1 Tax=Candidatus Enterococcus clewellii TaxID=1834193 RepID=A0A242KBZ6_9ENTE|nr:DUF523 domain-containing protein [Enterococcus sp. 9E7_DIV0242]OTP18486.1 hypothetical protein A5888_000300 [Enterococcus sp. 9E7_DIV0242]
MIGISSCLGGICCRYDGQAKTIPQLEALIKDGKAFLVCPEVLGGLPVPREPAEIIGGDGVDVWQNRAKVLTIQGEDVTEAFKQGAIIAYEQLKKMKINHLVMKENSPSCGNRMIYDGSFSGTHKEGMGVATAYFREKGIQVVSEADWECVLEEIGQNG